MIQISPNEIGMFVIGSFMTVILIGVAIQIVIEAPEIDEKDLL